METIYLCQGSTVLHFSIEQIVHCLLKRDDIFIQLLFCLLKLTFSLGFKPCLPRSNLPPRVPHFTGREAECDEIVGHMTSRSTRLVSVWGSPGFGKTSTAIAVGHRLHECGLPVYFCSLRGLKSKGDLTSKLLSLFRSDKLPSHHLTADDELGFIFERLTDRFVLILDNADDLFECGVPNVKEEVIDLIGEILNRNESVDFLLTTRESLSFLIFFSQRPMSIRIRQLDKLSSQALVQGMLPDVNISDLEKISQICGQVPLAIKLLCSSMSEDCAQSYQYVNELMQSTDNIVEMLDNPDYPSNLRLKSLFESSFQRLSKQDQQSLVSLSVLPEHFDFNIAAAVLGITRTTEAKKVLQRLQRKSLVDSCSNFNEFSIHKLLKSFAREKGELEMKETVLTSKTRFFAFYTDLFEKLTRMFLTGHSMLAFIEFFENEENIVQSLIDGCLNLPTAHRTFHVLAKAELFLHSLYWSKRKTFNKIYDSAIKAADQLARDVHRELLISRALDEVTWGGSGRTMQLLSHAKQCDRGHTTGKRLFYLGIYRLIIGEMEEGVNILHEALSFMNTSPEHTILKLVIFQIFSLYYEYKNDLVTSSTFYRNALEECKEATVVRLIVIPNNQEVRDQGSKNGATSTGKESPFVNLPLKTKIISLVSSAVKQFCNTVTNEFFSNTLLRELSDSKLATQMNTTGWFHFHRNAVSLLRRFKKYEEALELINKGISFHSKALLTQNPNGKEITAVNLNEHKTALADHYSECASIQYELHTLQKAVHFKQRVLKIRLEVYDEETSVIADSYLKVGNKQHATGDYTSALKSKKRALQIRLKLFGEEHAETSESYHSLGITQHKLGDYPSAVQSMKRALDIRLKLMGEEDAETAKWHESLGVIQHELGDYKSAVESHKRALDIRLKLLGEEHAETTKSYHSLRLTQQKLGDYPSAVQSKKRALDIRLKLMGKEHVETAESYLSLGVTQHKLGDYSSAVQSKKRALDIRLKLMGEEHAETAEIYHSLGVTQHELGDYPSAVQSKKRALDIRLKLMGEEHAETTKSYHSLGVTQHELGDYPSAVQSKKRALDIKLKLLGEEHPETAESYHSLGVTQNKLGDYTSAVQSMKRALDIRLKLMGEEHAETTKSYHSLGITQHELGDYPSAVQSKKRALDIRLKLLGEEHAETAESYHSLGITQHELGEYPSAIQSMKRALDIRLKLMGDEHAETTKSYHSLGITQHKLGDYPSAVQSKKRALDIRIKLMGKEHVETAESYLSLGVTQHKLGDYPSAVESKKRALDIRLKLWGEEHTETAESYHSLGVTQHKLGDYTSAVESKKRAIDIRLKLMGEEHVETAKWYESLGITQHKLGDYTSAVESKKQALDIRLKLLGEEHAETTKGYYSLGITQHELGDYTSAVESKKRALGIRLKLLGEEHAETSESYHSLGVTQHKL